mgnify:FL=1
MKSLLNYIAIILIVIVSVSYVLDAIYTKTYYSAVPRNKVTWLRQMDSTNLDYAIFGSSRCIHFIQPKIIKEKTEKDGLNLACVSCGPIEVKLMVKEFLNKHSAKEIFVQLDYSHNTEEPNSPDNC